MCVHELYRQVCREVYPLELLARHTVRWSVNEIVRYILSCRRNGSFKALGNLHWPTLLLKWRLEYLRYVSQIISFQCIFHATLERCREYHALNCIFIECRTEFQKVHSIASYPKWTHLIVLHHSALHLEGYACKEAVRAAALLHELYHHQVPVGDVDVLFGKRQFPAAQISRWYLLRKIVSHNH